MWWMDVGCVFECDFRSEIQAFALPKIAIEKCGELEKSAAHHSRAANKKAG
jgi:hypothetical protein